MQRDEIVKAFAEVKMKRLLLPLLFALFLPTSVNGGKFIVHGGRLNNEGCHNDKKKNNYHCHGSPKKEDLKSNNEEKIIIKSCYDGDTCTSTKGEKIRLACIDTPELRGSNADPIPAKEARDYLNMLIAGKDVYIKRITKDRYDRTVAELFIDDLNIQQTMVNSGFAKIYSKYAHQCSWARKL